MLRRAGNYALLVTTATSLLPHALKAVFDQTRPDRRTVLGHLPPGFRFPAGVTMPFHLATHCIWERSHPPPAHCLRLRGGQSDALAVGFALTRVVILNPYGFWPSAYSSSRRIVPSQNVVHHRGKAFRHRARIFFRLKLSLPVRAAARFFRDPHLPHVTHQFKQRMMT